MVESLQLLNSRGCVYQGKMSKENIATNCCPGKCARKQEKDGVPVFHSPLNDSIAPPNHLSKCTWNRLNDKGQINPHSTDDWKQTSKVLPNILEAIGNTPLVKLNKIPKSYGIKANIFVKCEYLNPGGSVKDRIGFRMVEDAERQGILKPGYTILEASSGNTGIGLALAAAVKGYPCIIVISEKMSHEKTATLRALGAQVVRVPVHLGSFSPDGLFGVLHRLHKEIPNSVILDQYSNPGNPLAHYDTTAEEIFDKCEGKVDMIVAGTGTGGTITGIGRKLKELSPNTKIVAADPEGSQMAQPDSLNKTDVTFFEVEGIGYDFVPTVLDRNIVDFWIKTNDKDSLTMARQLISEEGILCGASSGANVSAAMIAAKDLTEHQNVVVMLPDSIRNYLTKFIAPEWMQARGFMPCENINNHWWWDDTVTSLNLQPLKTADYSMTCVEVMNLMRNYGFHQMPVVDVNGAVIGIVTLQNLLKSLNSRKVEYSDPVEKQIMRIYPKLYTTSHLGLVSTVLEKESFIIILEKRDTGDHPIGIVTPLDILKYISQRDDELNKK